MKNQAMISTTVLMIILSSGCANQIEDKTRLGIEKSTEYNQEKERLDAEYKRKTDPYPMISEWNRREEQKSIETVTERLGKK